MPGELAMPGGRQIDVSAFQIRRFLTTVTVGVGCATLGASVFSGCTSLASVTLPSTLRMIGHWASRDCPALVTVAIPKECQMPGDVFKGGESV
jgi:hypothetical protein